MKHIPVLKKIVAFQMGRAIANHDTETFEILKEIYADLQDLSNDSIEHKNEQGSVL